MCPYGCLDPEIAAAIAINSAPADSSYSIAIHSPTALAAHLSTLAGSLPPTSAARPMAKGAARPKANGGVRPKAKVATRPRGVLSVLKGLRPGMAVMTPCPDNTDSPPGATDYTACQVRVRVSFGGVGFKGDASQESFGHPAALSEFHWQLACWVTIASCRGAERNTFATVSSRPCRSFTQRLAPDPWAAYCGILWAARSGGDCMSCRELLSGGVVNAARVPVASHKQPRSAIGLLLHGAPPLMCSETFCR